MTPLIIAYPMITYNPLVAGKKLWLLGDGQKIYTVFS